ncbi:MAG TPA: calcium-binding protein [Dongiaceae bacterium]|nr:calcium-binding protein [Dongiaceae bacterium]
MLDEEQVRKEAQRLLDARELGEESAKLHQTLIDNGAMEDLQHENYRLTHSNLAQTAKQTYDNQNGTNLGAANHSGSAHGYGGNNHQQAGNGGDGGVTNAPGTSGARNSCFGAGTPILMADGSRKPIEAIRAGDLVMSYGRDGALRPGRVAQLFVHEDSEFYDLDGMKVTGNHPFLLAEGRFQELDRIAPGSKVIRADGTVAPLPTLARLPGRHTSYNFGVEETHTYVAGSYRVHNKFVAPIALDLNGDGKIDLTSADKSTSFYDIANSGYRHHGGSVGAADGYLAIDRNNDGKIDVSEIAFANQAIAAGLGGSSPDTLTDLQAFALLYDSNHDGKFDNKDNAYAQAYVWQDANGDGVVDPGEVTKLGARGIASVGLSSDGKSQAVDGNYISGTGTFTWNDGHTGTLQDIGLQVSDVGFKVTHTGSGDLYVFASEDVALGPDPAAPQVLHDKFFQVADSGPNWATDIGGFYVDAVAAGYDIVQGGVGNDYISAQTAALDQTATDAYKTALNRQIAIDRVNLASAQAANDSATVTALNAEIASLTASYTAAAIYTGYVLAGGTGNDWLFGGAGDDYLEGGPGKNELHGGQGNDVLFVSALDTFHGGQGNDTAIITDIGGFTASHPFDLGATGIETVQGGTGNDYIQAGIALNVTLAGEAGDDTLIGGTGNDTLAGGEGINHLTGGAGDDTLIANEKDIIDGGAGIDTLVYQTNERVRVNIATLKVEIVVGSNNDDTISTDWDKPAVLFGSAGDDTLFTSNGNDVLAGNDGDDVLRGKAGDDTYRFDRGDGHDDIFDAQYGSITPETSKVIASTTPYVNEYGVIDYAYAQVTTSYTIRSTGGHSSGGNDTLEFGAGITQADLVFTFRGNDLYVGVKSTNTANLSAWQYDDSIKLTNWLDPMDRVENFKFADGTSANVASLVMAANHLTAVPSWSQTPYYAGTPYQDGFTNTNRDENFSGGAGDDLYSFGRGSGWDTIYDEVTTGTTTVTKYIPYDETFTLPVKTLSAPVLVFLYPYGLTWVTYLVDGTVTFHDTGVRTEYTENIVTGNGGTDSLVIDAGLGIDNLALRIVGDNLVIGIRDGANAAHDDTAFNSLADHIRLLNWYDSNQRVEWLTFRDGYGIDISKLQFAYAGDKDDDIIGGGDGMDWLSGGGGNDIISGGTGNDILVGNSGDDLVSGGAGNDVITGGDGNDILDYSDALQAVTVTLTDGESSATGAEIGTDRIWAVEGAIGGVGNDVLTGNSADNFLLGGKGVDRIDGGGGVNTISYQGSAAAVWVDLKWNVTHGGDAEGDVLSRVQNIVGSDHDDALGGDDGDNVFEGGLGADHLEGYGGSNTASYLHALGGVLVDLGQGKGLGGEALGDTFAHIQNVTGSAFGDSITGDGGANVLKGGEGDDIIEGGAGADTIDGGGGSDTVSYEHSAYAVSVTLTPGAGATGNSDAAGDTLTGIENIIGSAGNDFLWGSAGDNIFQGGAGADYINGMGGNDWAVYTSAVTIDLAGIDWVAGAYMPSGATVWINAVAHSVSDGDTLLGISNIRGGDGDDRILGDEGNNRIIGGAGNDVIGGYLGDDWVEGGRGDDSLAGGTGNDTVSYEGAAGGVTVNLALGTASGADGNDSLRLFENAEGSFYGDTLVGDGGANILTGGFGNDDLRGGAGNDTLVGGFGRDVYRFGLGDGQDLLQANDLLTNQDELKFDAGIAKENLFFSKSGDNLIIGIVGVGTGEKVTIQDWFKDSHSQLSQVTLSDGTFTTFTDIGHMVTAMAALAPGAAPSSIANFALDWHQPLPA